MPILSSSPSSLPPPLPSPPPQAEDAFVENAHDEEEEAKALEQEAEDAGVFGGRYERLGHKGEAGGVASREAAAAVLLQSHARGHFSRKQELAKAKAIAALATKTAEERAVLILQAYARGYKARRQHRARTKDVVKAEEEEMRRRAQYADEIAATRLQAHARGQKARKNMGYRGKIDRSDNASRKLADW